MKKTKVNWRSRIKLQKSLPPLLYKQHWHFWKRKREKESLLSRSCCRHSRSNQLGICGKEAAAEDQLITLQGERERGFTSDKVNEQKKRGGKVKSSALAVLVLFAVLPTFCVSLLLTTSFGGVPFAMCNVCVCGCALSPFKRRYLQIQWSAAAAALELAIDGQPNDQPTTAQSARRKSATNYQEYQAT